MIKPDFWNNQNQAQLVSRRAEQIKSMISQWDNLKSSVETALELSRESGQEDELGKELNNEYSKLQKQFNEMERAVLFGNQYDRNDAIISIHAGAGGTEAQDWAAMLYKMFTHYAESKKFNVSVLDESRGAEAGFKSISLEVSGVFAYGYFKSEAGVHRLVRISPFDAEKMRHTSFALVEVLPVLDTPDIEIKDSDLKIDTMRSGGAGGQSVNTTDSAVRITHIPTGIVVKCQNERSQVQNRQTAMKILQAKLAQLVEKAHGKEISEIRGELMAAEWGSQIRSYVLQPYKLVKDHRTEYESKEPDKILEGDLDGFVDSYLRYLKEGEK